MSGKAHPGWTGSIPSSEAEAHPCSTSGELHEDCALLNEIIYSFNDQKNGEIAVVLEQVLKNTLKQVNLATITRVGTNAENKWMKSLDI